jgi:DNA polymerase I-like protein with 3'-5' exonuclease and polymerase domains
MAFQGQDANMISPLPELSAIEVFALDFEAYDPGLTKLGPGFLTRNSFPLGFSIYTQAGFCQYYAIGHEDDNFMGPWLTWLKALCACPDKIMICANSKYELEVLYFLRITPLCAVIDIQTQEALIDENIGRYDLDSIAIRRGLGAKLELPVGVSKDDLRFVPPHILGPYCEHDSWLTYRIYQQQLNELKTQNLERVAALESELGPILFKMRSIGVRVDVSGAEQVNETLKKNGAESLTSLINKTSPFEPWSSSSIAAWLRSQGICHFPKTDPTKTHPDGQDSITNEWLFGQKQSQTCQELAAYRKLEKFRRDFVEGVILDTNYKGRLHPSWFSTRGSSFLSGDDSNGTRSGRIACVTPNLTQMPSRHPEYGPMLRKLFLPEKDEQWCKMDVASQEPRIGLHYCVAMKLEGAEEMRQRYIADPKMDYHQYVTDMVNKLLTDPISRNDGKTINLGLWYGLGVEKLSWKLGLSVEATKSLLDRYHKGVPFVRALTRACMARAEDKGFVTTILGRRRRFDEWENGNFNSDWEPPVKDKNLAQELWGRVKRSKTYKAANSVIQGTAAEQIKTAIVNLSKENIYPLIQVYDELSVSTFDRKKALFVKDALENAIKFNVPMFAEGFLAKDWAGTDKKKL